LLRHLDSYVVAARANAWSNGSEDISRISSKFVFHAAECRGNDARGGPSPPGVDSGYGSRIAIDQQNREAIGSANRDGDSRIARDNRVAFADAARLMCKE